MSVNVKKNIFSVFILISFVMTLFFTGCNKPVNEYSDNSGNFINGGIAVSGGKQIIYTDGKTLFKLENNRVETLTVIKGNIQGILNVYENIVYFFGGIEKEEGIIKKDEGYYGYNIDTGELKIILPYKPLGLSHYQDKIYFINPLDKNTIYMCTYEGKDMTKIVNETTMNLAMDNEYIYYVSGMDLALYRIKHDGTQVKDLNTKGVLYLMTSGSKLYYKDGYNEYKFTMINNDGTGKRIIIDDIVFSYNVVNNTIYFSSDLNGGGTYYMKADDKTNTPVMLFNDTVVHINIAGGYMFYRKLLDGRIYRRITDGSDEVLIQG